MCIMRGHSNKRIVAIISNSKIAIENSQACTMDVRPEEDCSPAVETLAFDDKICEANSRKRSPVNMNRENQPRSCLKFYMACISPCSAVFSFPVYVIPFLCSSMLTPESVIGSIHRKIKIILGVSTAASWRLLSESPLFLVARVTNNP